MFLIFVAFQSLSNPCTIQCVKPSYSKVFISSFAQRISIIVVWIVGAVGFGRTWELLKDTLSALNKCCVVFSWLLSPNFFYCLLLQFIGFGQAFSSVHVFFFLFFYKDQGVTLNFHENETWVRKNIIFGLTDACVISWDLVYLMLFHGVVP